MGTRLLLSLLTVLLATSLCCSAAEPQTEKSVLVSGKSECLDCAEKNVKTELAFQGLQVAIKCKTSNGDYKIKGVGKLDKNGAYKVQLPAELVGSDGALKQECSAQLHSVSNAPCPDNNGLNPSKLVLKFKKDGVHTFSTHTKLPFSSTTCTSAFFWPHDKPLPKAPLPPSKFPHKQFPPIYKKPCPPLVPVHKPPVPIYKPPVPIYKPPVPIYKPPVHKPPVPIYKPPVHKPPVPIYKPPVPIYKPPVPIKKPCPPIYKPPIHKKPLPPLPKFPPIHKKPLPPLPKFPPIHKKPLPPLPKFPPIYHKPLPPLPEFPPIYKKPYHPFPQYPPMYKKPPRT